MTSKDEKLKIVLEKLNRANSCLKIALSSSPEKFIFEKNYIEFAKNLTEVCNIGQKTGIRGILFSKSTPIFKKISKIAKNINAQENNLDKYVAEAKKPGLDKAKQFSEISKSIYEIVVGIDEIEKIIENKIIPLGAKYPEKGKSHLPILAYKGAIEAFETMKKTILPAKTKLTQIEPKKIFNK